jgi:hypothetical protein
MCNRPDYNRFFHFSIDFLIVIVIGTKLLSVIVIVIEIESKIFLKINRKKSIFFINKSIIIKKHCRCL